MTWVIQTRESNSSFLKTFLLMMQNDDSTLRSFVRASIQEQALLTAIIRKVWHFMPRSQFYSATKLFTLAQLPPSSSNPSSCLVVLSSSTDSEIPSRIFIITFIMLTFISHVCCCHLLIFDITSRGKSKRSLLICRRRFQSEQLVNVRVAMMRLCYKQIYRIDL